jgi:GH24 family phage-related lysozyme (muramidase)
MSFDQHRYEKLRLKLIDRNEGKVDNIYLDTLGIPTVGIGVALTARQHDRSMKLNTDHVDALADVMNLAPQKRRQLTELLQKHVGVQNAHKDESHSSLKGFLASEFGRDSQRVLGPMVRTQHKATDFAFESWDVLTSPKSPMQIKLSRQQTLDLFERVAPEYESRVDTLLKRVKCPPEALSEEQRSAIFSMVYHGAKGKAERTADAIGDYWRGDISSKKLQTRLEAESYDPKFPNRSRSELELLSHINERPQKRVMLDGQEAEPASALATLDQRGREVFDRIRPDLPVSVSDVAVLQATADILSAGLKRANSIENVALHNGAIFISADHTAGYASSRTIVDGREMRQDQALAQITNVNQQQEQANQQWMAQSHSKGSVLS